MTTTQRSSTLRVGLVMSLLSVLFVISAPSAFAGGFVVNSNDDMTGICTVASCNLRQAIHAANAAPGLDTISFALPEGATTIRPQSNLPDITDPVVIDGTTQPGFDGEPLVILQGRNPSFSVGHSTTSGLGIWSDEVTIRGLVINDFSSYAIFVAGDSAVIEGNYIGTDVSGMYVAKNGTGIYISEAAGVRIGGRSEAARNVISANTYGIVWQGGGDGVIQGNFIGTKKHGSSELANGEEGITIRAARDVVIGGTEEGVGNLISGNVGYGIRICCDTAGVEIKGNLIGTDVSGTSAVGNRSGMIIHGEGTTVGGASPGAGNVISGNKRAGIALVAGAANNQIQGNLIGTDASGDASLGNGTAGVVVEDATGPNTIGGTQSGEGNKIAFNRWGVVVMEVYGGADDTTIRGNSIFGNAELGIDLSVGLPDGRTANDPGDADEGGNHLQNAPVLDGRQGRSQVVHGMMSSVANTSFVIEFFSNAACDESGFGEGEAPAGTMTVTTDASGAARFTTNLRGLDPSAGLTATATDPQGNTSEFSNCL